MLVKTPFFPRPQNSVYDFSYNAARAALLELLPPECIVKMREEGTYPYRGAAFTPFLGEQTDERIRRVLLALKTRGRYGERPVSATTSRFRTTYKGPLRV